MEVTIQAGHGATEEVTDKLTKSLLASPRFESLPNNSLLLGFFKYFLGNPIIDFMTVSI